MIFGTKVWKSDEWLWAFFSFFFIFFFFTKLEKELKNWITFFSSSAQSEIRSVKINHVPLVKSSTRILKNKINKWGAQLGHIEAATICMGRGNNPHRYAGLWAPWEHCADLVPHSDLCPHLPPSTPSQAAPPPLPSSPTLFLLYRHISLFLPSPLFSNRFSPPWWSARLWWKTSRNISSIFFTFLVVFNSLFIFCSFAFFPTVSTASLINNASQHIKNISRVLEAVGGREETERGREGRKERVAPFSISVMENDVI